MKHKIISFSLLFFSVCIFTIVMASDMKADKVSDVLYKSVEPSVKVWIFFSDKDVNSSKDVKAFLSKSEYITKRAADRRKKRGAELYTLQDVPVSSKYIEKLASAGIKIENRSKWLNAVTARVDKSQLEILRSLDFVKKVSPVSTSKTAPSLPELKSAYDRGASKADSVEDKYNYGSSYEQISQLGINKLHNIGYTGRGVLIAIFDTGVKLVRETDEDGYVDRPTHLSLKDVSILHTYDFIADTDYIGMYDGSSEELIQLDHGTKILSLVGGYRNAELVSPAFGADFIIAKTEIVDTEIIAEEDNWIRAAEWAESLGTDIISSSLGYKEWYPYSMLTGDSANITKAANIAASKGVLVLNSIGNLSNTSVDRADTMISAPADGYGVFTVGGVDNYNMYATVAATGPTYDVLSDSTGQTVRYKPEICALAEYPYACKTDNDSMYGYVSGTSASVAITAGGCALLMQIHPSWTADMVKEAVMNTAYAPYSALVPDTALMEVPNYTVGYGIADFYKAAFYADTSDIVEIEQDAVLSPYPNPYSLSKNSSVVLPFKLNMKIRNLFLTIMTLDGRIVFEDEKNSSSERLLPGLYDTKENAFTWNGRNSGGQQVKPGLYLIMLDSGFNKSYTKLMIIP